MSSDEEYTYKDVIKNDRLFFLIIAFVLFFVFTGGLSKGDKANVSNQELNRALKVKYSDAFNRGYNIGKSAYYNGFG